jgi:hypothetical protein
LLQVLSHERRIERFQMSSWVHEPLETAAATVETCSDKPCRFAGFHCVDFETLIAKPEH